MPTYERYIIATSSTGVVGVLPITVTATLDLHTRLTLFLSVIERVFLLLLLRTTSGWNVVDMIAMPSIAAMLDVLRRLASTYYE